VILFTADESRTSISEAIQAGVSGYLLKDASADELVNAARLALEGKAVIHPRLTRAFIEEVRLTEKRVDTPPLSRREKEILKRVAYGATTNSPPSRRPMQGFHRYRASLRRSEAWPFLRALLLVMLAVVLVAVALSVIQSGT
jgi:CheY-like chemotaxis protein